MNLNFVCFDLTLVFCSTILKPQTLCVCSPRCLLDLLAMPPLQRQRRRHLLHTFTTLLLLPTLSTLYTSTPSSSFLVFAASPTTSSSATTWNTKAADGMNEKEFFLTSYLGTYCGAFGGWLLILGSVALYCRCTASSRRHGLNQYNGSVNFESFEQSMIVKVRRKKKKEKRKCFYADFGRYYLHLLNEQYF